MADNVDIKDASNATQPIATDQIGGAHFQRVKLDFGADGFTQPVTAVDPLPIRGTVNEDSSAASGDFGVFALGVRRDDTSGTNPTSVTGDYSEFSVNRKGATQVVPAASTLRVFRSAFLISTFVATATDIFALFGNGTTLVEVFKITVTGVANTAASRPIYLQKRYAANTGSTPVAKTAVRLFSGDTAAISAPVVYTVSNPTIAGNEGDIGTKLLALTAITSGTTFVTEWEFPRKSVILSSASQGIALNWGGAAIDAGMVMAVEIEWAEYVA
jgi:hypothetical protein